MKKLIGIIALIFIASLSVFAQKSTPMVDSKGHIMNHNSIIGKMTPEGSFDPSGKSMIRIDGNGNVVDLDGKVIGKAPKNGSFVYYFKDNEEKYTIGKANHTGMCKVTNAKGETVMLLHNNYKQQAACAVHCLYENHCMPNDMSSKEHKH
jgi:hypothetical protein